MYENIYLLKNYYHLSVIPVADPCEIREQLAGKCDKNAQCQIVNNKPSCR